ncbi:glutamate--tRNA(Gln) ligase / glutamyl-tRNA synthetase [Nitrosococcus oceani ATCC 19707]|uniref:Glutamate--tRNA ligase 2 n=2 Tax=Nitrosococcus oceani TaxID=1229 RepID=SYE2_NITOC|nr:glutamate--tRNA ligase [Nitrosococcus oceani]Q3J8Y8.1 RecName: Full=Glutamate--tRNA ligase 2; AltName: Full=Glutamyl-tRNA synthetase 2; Short=GluRS 2 [Nitrosococcus oceani ATCC 19707]KFI18785.1 glutamyl-tRNA synthetase [Nitrosococcus oceani C-27]ABA58708.1 glutamate--tRNA(Gln) ligase / glutamyl-tRNA synthetase [Nitrosococcus oceani ATCC 19707]EDZ68390.1 glutamyl-tRNA synthetase [Nitrosococcus oceani AFC27]GEM19200.1 glutamate--tRNA ligase [Nitrosococcus oceani]
MNKTALKTRFAPSPSGLLHLGNIRTALFNALLARRSRGLFLLRIEDTDQERSSEEYVTALMEDLRWLALEWQEGPEVEGEAGPYRQSQRRSVYQADFQRLEAEKLAYPCFCSQEELERVRKRQLAAGQAPRYPGTCARLSPEEVEGKLAAGFKSALRFRVPSLTTIEFEDLVRGPQRFATGDIGDFIIRRTDGSPAFFFSNALDDALMGVTHVLRGEDHLTNTPRQILLLRALGLPIPRYGHIAMIVGRDGAPLSKRHGSRSVRELREAGYLPEALCNYLARLGHHYEDSGFLDLDTLAAQFDLARLGRAPARFDPQQLHHWQREALARCDLDTLERWLAPVAASQVPADKYQDFIETVRPNVVLPEDALHWAKVLFSEELVLKDGILPIIHEAGAQFFTQALAAVDGSGTDFKALAAQLKQTTGAKGRSLFLPLRAAFTGELDGPELARLLPLMGVARVRQRLQNCVDQSY